jgi:CubicO group peptidase (beta-lactamase class C family)
MKRNFVCSLFLLLALCFSVIAQDYREQLAEIDAYAQKVQTEWNVPGFAVGIVKDDKVIFAKGYGVRELGKPEKVDENTLFAVASNSKAYTTASLAILVDEKKLNWDDKVSKYLPEFQMYDSYVSREITVRDLVSHRSGLDTFSGDLLWYDTTNSSDEIIRRTRYLKPTSSFRSKYGYQNLMFIAAAKVLEKISGKTWAQFVQEKILTPLKMTRTTTSVKDSKDNIASPHNESGGKLRVLPQGNVDNSWGACGINSSVSEFANWLRLHLNKGKFDGKQIISENQIWQMQVQNMSMPISAASWKFNPTRHFSGYGLGWFLNDYQGKKVVQHGGGLDGMISQSAMMPEENLGLIVVTNSETPVNTIMQNKIFDVMLKVLPKRDWSAELLQRSVDGKKAEDLESARIDATRAIGTKPTLAMKDYAAKYSSEMYGDVTIAEENGKLVMRLIPSPNFVADLEPWHYDTFQIKWRSSVNYNFPKGWVTFTIDKSGKTDELKIDQPNNDFWFYELDLKRAN